MRYRNVRVDDHNLTLLTMRSSGAVQEHGIGACDGHVERADISLAVLERDMTAVHTRSHGRAGLIDSRLCDCVIAVAELELDDVTDCGDDGVGDESILGTTDDHRDDLVLAANMWLECRNGRSGSRDGKKNADRLHNDEFRRS